MPIGRFRAGFALVVATLVAACGGGGGGGGDPAVQANNATPPAAAPTGQLVVVVGDDDINDWDQAIFEISRVLLLGGSDGQIVIVDEMRRIDFLALETVNEVLADVEVRADTYEKIRFEVDSITLVELVNPDDPAEGIVQQVEVQQSSHKVDVVPREGEFVVGENDNVVLEIDVDLEDSIKAHKTGNGKWKFRPVIFANVLTVDQPGGLIRIFGNDVQLLDLATLDEQSNFDLCDIDSMAEIDPIEDPDDCVNIVLNPETAIFRKVDMDGTLVLKEVGPDQIGDDDSAVVYGFVDPESDEFVIKAEIVALGGRDDYTFIECEADGPAAGDPLQFPCELDDDDDDLESIDDDDVVVTISMIGGYKLFNRHGEEAMIEDIKDGVDVEAEGCLVPSTTEGELERLDAFVVFVDDDADDEVEGILDAIDLATHELTVIDEDDSTLVHCVAYDDDTVFYKVIDDGDSFESGEVTVAELAEGIEVEASGVFDDGCLHATEIVFEVESLEED